MRRSFVNEASLDIGQLWKTFDTKLKAVWSRPAIVIDDNVSSDENENLEEQLKNLPVEEHKGIKTQKF